MKILVTGAAGFIGGNFCHYWHEKYPNDELFGLDSLTYAGHLETLGPLLDDEHFTFIKADITDRKTIDLLFKTETFDIVINFAAESHVDRSIENPELFLNTNILGTQVLMDLSLKYNVKRYHQVSTDEVYGDLPLDRLDLLFTESTPIHTSSPYSASKAASDLLVQAYYRTFKLPMTISRCSNNYGPYQFPEKLIPVIIENAINDLPVPVYGEGLNVRDWLYVKEHCEAIDLIIQKGFIGEVYNIGGNQEKRNIDVVKTILNYLNKDESLITYVEDRKGHDLRYAIDATKIKTLGWVPKILFEEGIKSTVDWYLNHQSWVNSVMKK